MTCGLVARAGDVEHRLLLRRRERFLLPEFLSEGFPDHGVTVDEPRSRAEVQILFDCRRRTGSLCDGGLKSGVQDAGRRLQSVADRETTQPHDLQKRRDAEGFATSCLLVPLRAAPCRSGVAP